MTRMPRCIFTQYGMEYKDSEGSQIRGSYDTSEILEKYRSFFRCNHQEQRWKGRNWSMHWSSIHHESQPVMQGCYDVDVNPGNPNWSDHGTWSAHINYVRVRVVELEEYRNRKLTLRLIDRSENNHHRRAPSWIGKGLLVGPEDHRQPGGPGWQSFWNKSSNHNPSTALTWARGGFFTFQRRQTLHYSYFDWLRWGMSTQVLSRMWRQGVIRCLSPLLRARSTCQPTVHPTNSFWNCLSWRVLEGLYSLWYIAYTYRAVFVVVKSLHAADAGCSPCRELNSNQQLRPETTPSSVVQLKSRKSGF